jgi:hypothetical protein
MTINVDKLTVKSKQPPATARPQLGLPPLSDLHYIPSPRCPSDPASGWGLSPQSPSVSASGWGLSLQSPSVPASGWGLSPQSPSAPASGWGLSPQSRRSAPGLAPVPSPLRHCLWLGRGVVIIASFLTGGVVIISKRCLRPNYS